MVNVTKRKKKMQLGEMRGHYQPIQNTHTQKGKNFLKYVSTRKRYLYQIRKGKNSYSNINRGLKKFKCNWHYELNVIKLRN